MKTLRTVLRLLVWGAVAFYALYIWSYSLDSGLREMEYQRFLDINAPLPMRHA